MAQQIITHLTDDFDGSEAKHSIGFGLDGKTYTIDLSDMHAGEMRRTFSEYTKRARRITVAGKAALNGGAPTRSIESREESKRIRIWWRSRAGKAATKGIRYTERGRIPLAVMKAYEARDSEPSLKARQSGKR